MDPDIRRAALRAAARLTLVSLAGCGAAVQSGTDANVAAESGDARATDADGGLCGTLPDAGTDPWLSCCRTHFDALVSRGGLADGGNGFPGRFASAQDRSDPNTVSCCQGLVAGGWGISGGEVFAVRGACCALVNGESNIYDGLGCTPWGPPMPPALDA